MTTPPKDTNLIEYRLGKVEEGVEKINNKLDGIANGFATQTQLSMAVKERDGKIADLRAEINELEERMEGAVTKAEFKIGLGVVTTILTVAVTILTIWEKMKG